MGSSSIDEATHEQTACHIYSADSLSRLQLAAHLQDQVLGRGLGPLGGAWDARPIGPIDSIRALAAGVLGPMVDRRGAHVELSGDSLVGAAAADGLDHGSATGGVSVSLLMVRPFQEVAFPTSLR